MMTAAEIVGHERQLSILAGAIAHGGVGNAYLFFGPPGVGKGRTALHFGRALLCHAGKGSVCGSCSSCRNAVASHPDLQLVGLEEGKKILRIGQVRDARERIALKPSLGGRKVAIFDPADSMNAEAANAMLKTLEEPPERTVIILVASNPGALPATVVSRCRKVSFGHLGEGEVREVLLRQGWAVEEAAAAAAVAEGSPGLALSVESEGWKRALALLEELLAARDVGAVLEKIEGKVQDRTEAENMVRILAGRVRRELRSRVGLEGRDAGRGLEEMDTERLLGLGRDLMETARLLDGNVNVKLAMGSLFSAWAGSFTAGGRGAGPAEGKRS